MNTDIFKHIKKNRIIKDVIGILNYDYVDIPVAKLNMGILREYDSYGVNRHFDKIIENT